MTKDARPTPFFLAEDRALDFLNSIATLWENEIEWIDDGRDLLAWLELADLVPPSVLRQVRKEAVPEVLDAIAARARELREWFRAFVANHAGQPLQSTALADLGPINRLLERDDSYRLIEASNSPQQDSDTNSPALRWRQHRRWLLLDALLLPLAESMGDLVCSTDFERVKKCGAPTCTLWFRDVSQNHTRRWCTMSVCGNRAKASAHRAKKRLTGSEPKKAN